MQLLIVAALVSTCAAARLEHLERGYLPPAHSHGQPSLASQGFGSQGSFGTGASHGALATGPSHGAFGTGPSHGAFGTGPSHGSFDSNVIDSTGAGSRGQLIASSGFPGATSNQYLPPDHGPSGSNGQFSGSLNGFQRPQYTPNQYGAASTGVGQARYQQQPSPSALRQYLAPRYSSFQQNTPQQPFDENTGYIY